MISIILLSALLLTVTKISYAIGSNNDTELAEDGLSEEYVVSDDLQEIISSFNGEGRGGYGYRPGYGSSSSSKLPIVAGAECLRTCSTKRPRICYFKFVVEEYLTLTDACANCSVTNNYDCDRPQCVSGDGYEYAVRTVNRQIPGPEIQVCKGDTIVVDVINNLIGPATSIHWHGILQRGTPYMDGVPMLTQCPILPGTTFRYRFRVMQSGTYFWHAHSGFQIIDGISGPLIIRERTDLDPLSKYYDYDLPEHYIYIQDTLHELGENIYPGRRLRSTNLEARSILINGRGRYVDIALNRIAKGPYHVYYVNPNTKYRFRVVNAGGLACPLQLQIQNHRMLLIATDGEPIQPVYIDTLVTFSGERYDFVLETKDIPWAYWIQVKGIGPCTEMNYPNQVAILMYAGAKESQLSKAPGYFDNMREGVVMNSIDEDCDDPKRSHNKLCVQDLSYGGTTREDLSTQLVNISLYIPIGFHEYMPDQLFVTGQYYQFIRPSSMPVTPTMGADISYVQPTAPLLSQLKDADPKTFCTQRERPPECQNMPLCFCTYVEHIPYNSVVQVVIVDTMEGANLTHPFHLHGYTFQVISQGRKTGGFMMAEQGRGMDAHSLNQRNIGAPTYKDTVPVQSSGYAIIRFRADNPGFWNFHCHISFHRLFGMQMVFHVGGPVPPPPENFPRCKDFIPSIF